MSKYARQIWQDCAGGLHDTEEESRRASRQRIIDDKFSGRHSFGSDRHAEISWFLKRADTVMKLYKEICAEVDADMEKETEHSEGKV